jgi:hypothetical protein
MRVGKSAMGPVRCQWRCLCAVAVLFLILTVVAGRAIAQDAAAAHPTLGTIPPFQPPPWVDERDDIVGLRQWLPDGRLAIAGNTALRENGYLRIIDPETEVEEDYYLVGGDGVGPMGRTEPSVVAIGDDIFLLNRGGDLMRASKRRQLMTRIDLGFYTEEYADAASGAILADGNSVLVSWWESVPSKRGYCGDGAVVARLSSAGKILWRWRDRQGGDNFPNDMVVLKNGTIIVLVEGHSTEFMGSMWEAACGHGYEYLVALSPDGQEIARRSIPRGTWLQKLSLGWSGDEVIAAGGYLYKYVNEIVRISVEGSSLKFDWVPLSRIVSIDPSDDVVVTPLEGGDFSLDIGPHPIRMRIDDMGRLIETKDLNPAP